MNLVNFKINRPNSCKSAIIITRFYWLDILRGIAALSVVLWHWQHFFYNNHLQTDAEQQIDKTLFPFYNYLRAFYGQGWRAVEFFFTLSGFIFYWLYSKKISNKLISFSKYLKLRISRLYPLHILMLMVILAEQYIYYIHTGVNFIYHDYRIVSFLANLTLTDQWFSSHFSFNGPVWSVSVEMLLYLLFFLLCFLKLNRSFYTFCFIIIGWLLKGTSLDFLGTGIMSFYVGGISFYIYTWGIKKFNKKSINYFIAASFFLSLIIIITDRYIFGVNLPFYFFELFLFPVIIIDIALLESAYGSKWGKRFSFIGDISYSSYLIHFPLQLAFVLAAYHLGLAQSIFYDRITLVIFYLILIILSLLSFNYFEKPIQNWLRKKWVK